MFRRFRLFRGCRGLSRGAGGSRLGFRASVQDGGLRRLQGFTDEAESEDLVVERIQGLGSVVALRYPAGVAPAFRGKSASEAATCSTAAMPILAMHLCGKRKALEALNPKRTPLPKP